MGGARLAAIVADALHDWSGSFQESVAGTGYLVEAWPIDGGARSLTVYEKPKTKLHYEIRRDWRVHEKLAQGPSFQLRETMRKAVREGLARARVRARAGANRYPRRAEAEARAPRWTSGLYMSVCDMMRRGQRAGAGPAANLIRAMDAYMTHSAPRVPEVPRGVAARNALVLWRGVELFPSPPLKPKMPRAGDVVPSNGGCYTAMSHRRDVALQFASQGGVLFRLDVSRIVRGTPWVWYTGDWKGPREPGRRARELPGAGESEVLLPPGFFKVLSVRRRPAGPAGPAEIDVAFAPDPRYARRAALPVVGPRNNVVLKTRAGPLRLPAKSPYAAALRSRRVAAAGLELASKQVIAGIVAARKKALADDAERRGLAPR